MVPLGWGLTEEQELIWQTARAFAQEKVAPTAAFRDANHEFPHEIVKSMGELGLLGIKIPSELGGADADHVSYVLAMAAMSEACASTGVTLAVCNLFADVLSKFGSQRQKEAVLRPYLAGRAGPGAFCLSEPEAGSDPAAMKATARQDGDRFILNGAKQWITNGSHASYYLVFAITDESLGRKGMSCFLVEKGTPGLTIGAPEKKMGLRSSDTVPLTFEDCAVAKDSLIGECGQGYSIALSGLDGGRIGIAAQCIGIASAALEAGVRYAADRKIFGQTVASFQASQMAIADSKTDLDQSWLLTMRAAYVRDTGKRSAKESSMAKLFASEACGRIVDRMLQLHGGYGYVEEFPIERFYRDARVTRIYEGASEIQRLVIAREILKA
jgi:acyl-CoA dehydrogenase